ncbi:Copine family protein 2 [Varanus komodoensis]|nr:Copine family protein 2 [Varanus komodoensis]
MSWKPTLSRLSLPGVEGLVEGAHPERHVWLFISTGFGRHSADRLHVGCPMACSPWPSCEEKPRFGVGLFTTGCDPSGVQTVRARAAEANRGPATHSFLGCKYQAASNPAVRSALEPPNQGRWSLHQCFKEPSRSSRFFLAMGLTYLDATERVVPRTSCCNWAHKLLSVRLLCCVAIPKTLQKNPKSEFWWESSTAQLEAKRANGFGNEESGSVALAMVPEQGEETEVLGCCVHFFFLFETAQGTRTPCTHTHTQPGNFLRENGNPLLYPILKIRPSDLAVGEVLIPVASASSRRTVVTASWNHRMVEVERAMKTIGSSPLLLQDTTSHHPTQVAAQFLFEDLHCGRAHRLSRQLVPLCIALTARKLFLMSSLNLGCRNWNNAPVPFILAAKLQCLDSSPTGVTRLLAAKVCQKCTTAGQASLLLALGNSLKSFPCSHFKKCCAEVLPRCRVLGNRYGCCLATGNRSLFYLRPFCSNRSLEDRDPKLGSSMSVRLCVLSGPH